MSFKISLYNTEITPSRNLAVDNVEHYLSTLTSLYSNNNANKLKIDLDLDIKLNLSQDVANGISSGNPNYLRYQEDNNIYYFFIMATYPLSAHTLRLELSLDTINTFKGLFTFGKKTQIIRNHRDRFVKPLPDYEDREEELDEQFNYTFPFINIRGSASEFNVEGNNPAVLDKELMSISGYGAFILKNNYDSSIDKTYTYLEFEDGVEGDDLDIVKTFIGDNELTNGDFSDGTTGWFGVYSTISVSDNIATVTSTSSTLSVQIGHPYLERENNHYYYVSAIISVPDISKRIYFNYSSGGDLNAYYNETNDTFEKRSDIFKWQTGELSSLTIGYDCYELEIGTQFQVKEVVQIDVTDYVNAGMTDSGIKNMIENAPQSDNLLVRSGKIKLTGENIPLKVHIPANVDIAETRKQSLKEAMPFNEEFTLRRYIDRNAEGIEPVKYLSESEEIQDDNDFPDAHWYLIYQTNSNLSEKNINNPVSSYLLSDTQILATLEGSDLEISVDFTSIFTSGFLGASSEYVEFNNPGGIVRVHFLGSSHYVRLGITGINENIKLFGTFPLETGTITRVTLGRADNTTECILKFYGTVTGFGTDVLLYQSSTEEFTTANATWQFVKSEYYTHYRFELDPVTMYVHTDATDKQILIDPINLQEYYQYDSKTIKIIELPYCPDTIISDSSIPGSYKMQHFDPSGTGVFKSKSITPDLERDNAFRWDLDEVKATIPVNKDITRNDYFESKLFSSEFYSLKLVYDSFEKDIPLETYDFILDSVLNTDYNPQIRVDYKVTNTINSTFAFRIYAYLGTINWYHLHDDIFIVKRNNEYPIYSSSYIDYIKNGYRYDLKANTLSEKQRWVSTGLSIAGAVGSATVGALTGNVVSTASAVSLTTSAINSISSNITASTLADNNLEGKLATLKSQATSIAGSDDIDLLEWYSNNHAFKVIEKPREQVTKLIGDLFYYAGYACNYQGVPNIHSRKYFDYLLCEPDFDDDNKYIYANYMDDIKARFRAGVTYMHEVDGDYNWNQDKENHEIWWEDN